MSSSYTRFQEMSVGSGLVACEAPCLFYLTTTVLLYCVLSLECSRRLILMSSPRSSPGPSDSQQTLKPMSYMRPHSAHLLSPASDIVGPSPVTSNGTETTEIDDEEQETVSPPAVPEDGGTPQVGIPPGTS